MDIEGINLSPKFVKYLASRKTFEKNPLVVIDVGARGGFELQWAVFGNQARIIGFEPDKKECELLNASQSDSINRLFYPFVIFKNNGKHAFYVAEFPDSSGLYPLNSEFVKRFPDEKNLAIKECLEVETIELDSFTRLNNVENVDFIKLDTEGSEYDILEGALKNIKKSVIGIKCEAFFDYWHKGQKVFSDIDFLLRSLGFSLFNLSVNRHARKSFPELQSAVMPMPSKYGQAAWCDALYLRDAVGEISHKKSMDAPWDEIKVLKLISLFEIFRLPDCAIELLQCAHEKGILQYTDKEMERFCNLLIADFTRHSYRQYFMTLKKIEKRGYINNIQRVVNYLRKSSFVKKQYYRIAPILTKSPFFIKIIQYLLRR